MFLFQFSLSSDLTSALGVSSSTQVSVGSSNVINFGDFFSKINGIVSNIDFMNPTWDMFIILFFLLAVFIYGITLGRERIILMLISIYMGIAILRSSPFLENIIPSHYGPNNIFIFNVSLFLGLFVVLFFLLSRSRVLRTVVNSNSGGEWWQVIVFSILQVGLLISVVLSFIPEDHYKELSSFTREWFLGDQTEFFWIISPIVAMALLREKNN